MLPPAAGLEAYRETFIFPGKAVRAVGKRIEIFIVRQLFLCHLLGLFPD
jgi:hypothetical protein